MITWQKTGNTTHGTEVEVFRDGVSLGRIWAGSETTDEQIDAKVADWVSRQEQAP